MLTRLRAAGCVFAEDEAALMIGEATSDAQLGRFLTEREAGRPLEQIVGWAEFCGLRIAVEPGVFVPRRRTELLVEQAVALAPRSPVVVDLCCGSGAVGAALTQRLADLELWASDIDEAAVRCTTGNVVGATVLQGDLFDALPASLRGRIDLVVANAPYVPTAAIALMPSEARDHEPLITLDGGADGISVHRRIAAEASDWLATSGSVLIETSERQARHTAEGLQRHALDTRIVRDEDRDATVVIGQHRTAATADAFRR